MHDNDGGYLVPQEFAADVLRQKAIPQTFRTYVRPFVRCFFDADDPTLPAEHATARWQRLERRYSSKHREV